MFDPDVVSFAHGEGVRRPYPEAISAMMRALADPESMPLENYMFLQRFTELEEAVAAEMSAIGVPGAHAANVAFDAGTTRLIIAALELMTEPGDTVVTFSGHYHPLASWCAYRNLDLHVVPTSAEEGHRPSAARLEAHLSALSAARPPVLVLFNPSMTGAICDRGEIERIGALIARHEMWAIEDALFANCTFGKGASPQRLAATSAADRVLTVAGASKLHGLANLRIGWGCGASALINPLRDYITASSASLPHLVKVAALASLRAPGGFRSQNVREIGRRLQQVARIVGQMDTRLRTLTGHRAPLLAVDHMPEAGHSILLDFGGFVDAARRNGLRFSDSADLARWFLDSCKVAFSPAQSHGFDGFRLRVNVASVGTSFTYTASRALEADWDDQWSPAHEASFEKGFAEGRSIIDKAMTDRVEPAMARALTIPPPSRRRSLNGTRPHAVNGLQEAVGGCDAVLMDVWGVLTDGEKAFEPGVSALNRLIETGRPVMLLSNTSRRGNDLAEKLSRLGIPPTSYTAIITGGDLAFDCAVTRKVGGRAFGDNVLLVGEQPGGHWAEEAGMVVVEDVEIADVVLGLGILNEPDIGDTHLDMLRRAAGRGLPFLISNADSRVRLGDQIRIGAGALAPHYRAAGGEPYLFGKPHDTIFAAAIAHLSAAFASRTFSPERLLMVGDSLATDIGGAAAFGARTLLVTATGIHGAALHKGPDGALCDEALARLCDEHAAVPDATLADMRW
ncbi:TIGR01459 family HAD-type hydrolase [Oceaniradius stylonematis]|nr:TIGR01459 family HAD-type hydrolase [Oceaniradius stylonematis]